MSIAVSRKRESHGKLPYPKEVRNIAVSRKRESHGKLPYPEEVRNIAVSHSLWLWEPSARICFAN